MLSSNTSSTYPRNMVNFGPLTAEIRPVVWGTPANFNGFRILAALLHDTGSGCQPNFAALNRGRQLYSAGRPSRWTLAHILVLCMTFTTNYENLGKLIGFRLTVVDFQKQMKILILMKYAISTNMVWYVIYMLFFIGETYYLPCF